MIVSRFSILAAICAVGIGVSFADPRLPIGVVLIYALNVAVSYWLEYETHQEYAKVAGVACTRFFGYSALGLMSLIVSWTFRGVPLIQKVIFGGMVVVEFIVGIFMLAEIVPRLRSIAAPAAEKIEGVVPIPIRTERLRSLVQPDDDHHA